MLTDRGIGVREFQNELIPVKSFQKNFQTDFEEIPVLYEVYLGRITLIILNTILLYFVALNVVFVGVGAPLKMFYFSFYR